MLVVSSCSPFFKTYMLAGALTPISKTSVTYNEFTFSNALFNQFTSSLSYDLIITSDLGPSAVSIFYQDINGTLVIPPEDFLQSGINQYTATLNNVWSSRLSNVLFGRDFNIDKKASYLPIFSMYKSPAYNLVTISLIIRSTMSFNVSVGAILLAYGSFNLGGYNDFNYISLKFYDRFDNFLNSVDLASDSGSRAADTWLINIGNVLTNVKRFDLEILFVDTPPYSVGDTYMTISEFNLFSESPIKIEDDIISDNVFGTSYQVVEWYDVFGHLNNFIYWIVNKSFLSPLFFWVDKLIINAFEWLIYIVGGIFS